MCVCVCVFVYVCVQCSAVLFLWECRTGRNIKVCVVLLRGLLENGVCMQCSVCWSADQGENYRLMLCYVRKCRNVCVRAVRFLWRAYTRQGNVSVSKITEHSG